MPNDSDGVTGGGESNMAQDQTVDRRYSEFTNAQDAWESAVARYGDDSRQARQAWDAQVSAWNAYTAAGGKSSRASSSGRRSVPGGRAGGRRSSDPRGGGGELKGPNSPPVDQ